MREHHLENYYVAYATFWVTRYTEYQTIKRQSFISPTYTENMILKLTDNNGHSMSKLHQDNGLVTYATFWVTRYTENQTINNKTLFYQLIQNLTLKLSDNTGWKIT